MVERRLFRADLFYRLSGVDIRVPPLRERRQDILELASYFLERHRRPRPLRLSAGRRGALGITTGRETCASSNGSSSARWRSPNRT